EFWLKSKGKPNGKKPAPEEKKLYLEPEYTKSRITDFEFKELRQLSFITSTYSIVQSQNSVQESRVRPWQCAIRKGSESRLEQKVKKSLLDPDFIRSGQCVSLRGGDQ
uniref:Uncharacterized protein n=1 Tax=Pavo cristatus TaxID=9049 RepID=A0A8C9L160_PAVCR